ncbi:MAG: endonuclease V [Chloroflexi bacterium]|nr:endonuclease V [Chloroflexota bacterium]
MDPLLARPTSSADLVRLQESLRELRPAAWSPGGDPLSVGGCFVVFPRGLSGPGAAGDPAVASAVVVREGRTTAETTTKGQAGAPYEPGLLFLREGAVLHEAVSRLRERVDVLMVNGTGLDHPRRAGLALHLGAVLGLPTVGVTHRPLCADGPWPEEEMGSMRPLLLDGDTVGYWLRTRRGARPLAVHAGWKTDAGTAVEVVMAVAGRSRTPEPLRLARRLARSARASDAAI